MKSGLQKQAECKVYFDLVKDPADWRNPIDSIVDTVNLTKTLVAITFFTGTQAEYQDTGNRQYRVTSVGYRNGPCGP